MAALAVGHDLRGALWADALELQQILECPVIQHSENRQLLRRRGVVSAAARVGARRRDLSIYNILLIYY